LKVADNPSVAMKYGDFGSKIQEGISSFFTRTPGSKEPIEVARLIADIVDQPPGKRKLWTAIGMESGQSVVEAINDSTIQFSKRVQDSLGIYS
jgi:hypothetical protein